MSKMDWKKAVTPVVKSNEDTNTQTPAQRATSNMDAALKAFKQGKDQTRRSPIQKRGDVIAFSVKFGSARLALIGADKEFTTPAAQFENVYAAIREDIAAGLFDEQLTALTAAAKARSEAARATRASNKK